MLLFLVTRVYGVVHKEGIDDVVVADVSGL